MKFLSSLLGGALVSALLATSADAHVRSRLDHQMLALHGGAQPLAAVDRVSTPSPIGDTATGGPAGGLPDRN